MKPGVSTYIDSYRPSEPNREAWELGKHLVLERVRKANPATAESARQLLGPAARMLTFAVAERIPLEPDILFSDATIEGFIAAVREEARKAGRERDLSTMRGRL